MWGKFKSGRNSGETDSPVMGTVENGFNMTRYSRRKIEEKQFRIKLDTREIVWSRNNAQKTVDAVNTRDIKEIRKGKVSKDFEKWLEEVNKVDINTCFSIYYGNKFVLKTLSLNAKSSLEADKWVKGLNHLCNENKNVSSTLVNDIWLKKEFSKLERNETINMRDLKPWIFSINQKLSNLKIKEVYQEIDSEFKELNFVGFKTFYQKLILLNVPDMVQHYIKNKSVLTAEDFQDFVLMEQKDLTYNDIEKVKRMIVNYLDDPFNQTRTSFTVSEFCDYLFSRENSIFQQHPWGEVSQNMDLPLNYYWIASSHNTYLTGDQIKSESSTDAYARVLRMGCRCIELDCWDGPDQYPIIFHGHTLTTKIRFMDVLKTIKENAWVASEYPLILSIENHCSIVQQRNMSLGFKDVFRDDLLVEPLTAPNPACLPSPNQLKRKIIIKHKKLPEGDTSGFVKNDDEAISEAEMIMNGSVKNGILYMEDPIEKKWNPHFFMLSETRLNYTEQALDDGGEGEDGGDDITSPSSAQNSPASLAGPNLITNTEEMHFSEEWFHGKLPGGRLEAERLLKQYGDLGDGTFLVRESETFVGDYSLSLWRTSNHNHCRIRSRHDKGRIKYFLVDQNVFDSLYSLITYYKQHPLKSSYFQQVLTQPVPQPEAHRDKEWYYENLSRDEAEDMLSRIQEEGVFLVRRRQPSTRDNDLFHYAISFRSEGKIKHCKIKKEDRLFVMGNATFETLVELVNYYKKCPLYRKMKLKYAATEQLIKDLGVKPRTDCIYHCQNDYQNPNEIEQKQLSVRALYDFRASKNDELTFCKHAIITNVQKEDGGWWKGDYAGRLQVWFPANYVEEVNTDAEVDGLPLGKMQKGFIDLAGVTVDRLPLRHQGDRYFIFRIISPVAFQSPIEIATTSEEDMQAWLAKIRESSCNAERQIQEIHIIERSMKIAKELSDVIVYCQPVKYSEDKVLSGKTNYYEMFSLPETRVFDKNTQGRQNISTLIQANKKTVTRIYPKGQRIDSSNYDPMIMWNCGCQLVALNYQTGDKSMQLNHGRFMVNGGCGYVLQPECLRLNNFNPYLTKSLPSRNQSITIVINILGARHLIKTKKGLSCPFVEVEIVGCQYDNNKYKTKTFSDNGLNPTWSNEMCTFDIINPDMCLLRFVLQDEDMFGDPNFLGQATYPLSSLRTGMRSVQLRNEYSEEMEMSALLVFLQIENFNDEDDTYSSIQDLRDDFVKIQLEIENKEKKQENDSEMRELKDKKSKTEKLLIEKNEQRLKARLQKKKSKS